MSSTVKIILVSTIVVLSVGFIFFRGLFTDGPDEETDSQTTAEQKLPVSGIVINQTTLDNTLRSTGSLMANESVELKSEVSGLVENIHFEEGQKVKKGQLLISLNDDEISAEIEKLKFTQKLNEDIEGRQNKLLEREAISKEEYETALTTLNTTRADIKLREVQLAKHKIRAPFDGIIGLRLVSEGSYLNPSDNIATLYSTTPIKINFSIPGKYSSQINPGDKIAFTTDSYNETFHGEIYAIEPQIDPKTRSLQLRAKSPNTDNRLLPGEFAKINLTLETYDSAMMIPTQAVIPELNGKKVFVYKNGVAEAKSIETGIRTADKIQVISGLMAGDTVLTSGTLQLQPGLAVEVEIQSSNE